MKNVTDLTSTTVLLGFGKYTISGFYELAAYIVLCMTANIYFVTPDPAIADVAKLVAAYDAAVQAAKSRDRNLIAARTTARKKLTTALQLLGRYVMATAADAQQVESSGFPTSRRGMPVPSLPAITNFTIEDGPIPYSIKASADGSPLIKSYNFQITDEPPTKDTVWRSEPGTVKEFVFTNLIPEKRYYFRLVITGTKGQRQYSNVLSRMVQ